MAEPIIHCPNCNTEIRLTESLAAPLIAATRRQFENKIAEKDREISEREGALLQRESLLNKSQRDLERRIAEQVETQLAVERSKIAATESKKATLAVAVELEAKAREVADLQDAIKTRDDKLADAHKAQVELLKKRRELEDAKLEFDLTVEQRVQAGLTDARSQAKREAEEALKLKVMEKDQTIASMQQKIEELKQKAEQGSQQLQGEVQELELENLLRSRFPYDSIDPVPKGEFGGDALQRVVSSTGQPGGIILWESKRTRHWSDGWLPKLREDQRAAGADVSVIVSQVLPKEIETFDVIDGVWVTHPRAVLPVAAVLRQTLLQVAVARQVSNGQQTKAELVYRYLTGSKFRQRVEAIVEAFSSMREDLDKERKAIQKQWAKRQEQIEHVIAATVGMHGDLQGIAGSSMQEIEGLELQALGFEKNAAG